MIPLDQRKMFVFREQLRLSRNKSVSLPVCEFDSPLSALVRLFGPYVW